MSIYYRIKPDFAQALEAVHHIEEGEPYRRPFFVALMLAHVASIPGITQDAIIAATHYMRGLFTPDLRSDPRTALALREAERCETTQGDGHAYRARLLREVVVALPKGTNLEPQAAALPTLSGTALMIVVWALILVAEDFASAPASFCQDNQVHHPDRLYFEMVDPDVCEPAAALEAQEEARATMEAMARCYIGEIERREKILHEEHERREQARAKGIRPRDEDPSDEDRPAYMDALHASMECLVAGKHLAELVERLRVLQPTMHPPDAPRPR